VILNRQEKERLVLKLANEGKNTREIAKEAHVSLRDIGHILGIKGESLYLNPRE
jgi:transposase